MTSFGDDPLSPLLKAPAHTAPVALRPGPHNFVVPFPGLETSTQSGTDPGWGPGKAFGFIFGSGAVLWGLILGGLALLR